MVYRIKRLKTKNGLKNALLHNTRKLMKVKDFVDEKRTKYNISVGAQNSEELWKLYEEKLKLITSKRKRQKNSSWGVEEVHSFSHEFCLNWQDNVSEKNNIIKYFQDIIEAIQKKRGRVILGYFLHFDESTPHIHILYIPLVYTNENICKFSSSEFVGKRADLRAMQTYLYENVGKKNGLIRGVEGSRAAHVDLKDYIKHKNNNDKELNNNNTILQNLLKSNKNINEQLIKDKNEIEKLKKEILAEKNDLTKKRENINRIMNTYDQINEYVDKDIVVDIPRIPIPPFEAFEEKRRNFVDFWQDKFNKVIKKLVSQLKAVLFKNNELLLDNNFLKNKCEKAEDRAFAAEKDLAEKPINQIILDREKKINDGEEKKVVNKKGSNQI